MLDTRDESYKELIKTEQIETQKDIVLRCNIQHKKITRQTITELTGLEINAVCGRVKELLDECLLIEEKATGTRGLLRVAKSNDKPIKKECLTDTEFSKLIRKLNLSLQIANPFQKNKLKEVVINEYN